MAERVIWERDVDHDRIRDRKARFRKRFGIPAAIVFVAVLLLGGPTNAIGVLFLLGLIGLSWGMTVRFQNLNEAANPRLVVDRGRLILGNREVIIEDVKRFSTIATALHPSVFRTLGEIELCTVVFRMDVPGSRSEPDLVEFGWPNMGAEGADSLKDALDPVFAGKWVEPEQLLEPNERPETSRSRARGRKRR